MRQKLYQWLIGFLPITKNRYKRELDKSKSEYYNRLQNLQESQGEEIERVRLETRRLIEAELDRRKAEG